MPRKNIKSEDGKPFKKGDKRINRKGRPKKLIGTVNEELENKGFKEATKQEILSCYLRLINVGIPELEKIEKDKKHPALVRIVSENILSGKGFDIIERMLDRSVGRPEQKTDITSKGEKVTSTPTRTDLSHLSLEELKLLQKLKKKIRKHGEEDEPSN